MTEFFKNLTDNDFLSDKLTHIYFNDIVDDKSVNKLIEDIRNANKNIEQNGVIIKPKPILIHINSKGGSVYDGMRFLSIFNISSVPIATMIDNYSFSAATFLSIHSPYRVMTKYSLCLLHYYSVTFYNKIKRERLFTELTELENYFSKIIDMYLKNTKIKKEELHDLLQHDLFINYKFCLEKGIVDRVIDFNHPPVILKRNIYDIIKDEKTINLHLLPCETDIKSIDSTIIKNNELKDNVYLIYPINSECEKKDELNNKRDDSFNIFHIFNLINRIKAIKSVKYTIIDVPISIDNLVPLLYSNKIFMYSHSFIICNLLYLQSPIKNILMIDTIKNFDTIFNKIKTILKQKTKMSLNTISEINKKYIIINPKEALKLGLCHEIIYA